jgi:hypothetical protein
MHALGEGHTAISQLPLNAGAVIDIDDGKEIERVFACALLAIIYMRIPTGWKHNAHGGPASRSS